MGLSSVKGFVEQAKGSMKISSDPGMGTTVSLVFPECDFEQPAQAKTSVSTGESIQPEFCNCLVVEDDATVRDCLVLMVEGIGYGVESCHNADVAKDLLLHRHDIQVVISDISMPGRLDGIDLAKWVAAERPDIKVVLVSGNEAPVQPGKWQFLRKPFRFKELAHAIESAIGSESTTASSPS